MLFESGFLFLGADGCSSGTNPSPLLGSNWSARYRVPILYRSENSAGTGRRESRTITGFAEKQPMILFTRIRVGAIELELGSTTAASSQSFSITPCLLFKSNERLHKDAYNLQLYLVTTPIMTEMTAHHPKGPFDGPPPVLFDPFDPNLKPSRLRGGPTPRCCLATDSDA